MRVKPYDFIQHIFETLPVLKGDEAVVAINILYDQYFGIFPMEGVAKRPLATVAITEVEEYGRKGPLYSALEQYSKSAVAEFFPGLSVEHFLGLPLETANFIVEISEQRRLIKLQEATNAANSAENALKAIGQNPNLTKKR